MLFCMAGQRSRLVLEEIGLDLDRVLHVLDFDQLVAEIECRGDIALPVTAELLGLIGDRQLRGAQALLEQVKILRAGLPKAFEIFGQHRSDLILGKVGVDMINSFFEERTILDYLGSPPNQAPKYPA